MSFTFTLRWPEPIYLQLGYVFKSVFSAATIQPISISFGILNCSLELKLVNSDIEQVDGQKLLGVTIDKHLSFDVHVEEPCKKLSQRIAVLRKIRRFILIEQRILYYNAMIKQVTAQLITGRESSSCKNVLPA